VLHDLSNAGVVIDEKDSLEGHTPVYPPFAPMRRSFRLDPLHAMVARHRDDLFGRADLEERPRAGNPRVLREDALVHVDPEAGSPGHREDSLANLERLREDLVGQREW